MSSLPPPPASPNINVEVVALLHHKNNIEIGKGGKSKKSPFLLKILQSDVLPKYFLKDCRLKGLLLFWVIQYAILYALLNLQKHNIFKISELTQIDHWKNNIQQKNWPVPISIDDYAKKADQGWSDFYVVFTTIICTPGLKQLLISMIFQVISQKLLEAILWMRALLLTEKC